MMVVITGASGFLGRKLAQRLLARGRLTGADGEPAPIDELVLFDVVPVQANPDPRVKVVVGDLADGALLGHLVDGADSVFHLAAVVSAAAESDFDLGYRANLDGTRNLLEAARVARAPRLVFASSIAVYGGALDGPPGEAAALWPKTSYGTQKAVGELLVNDYTRKGFVDGRCLRLPTIVVRPGLPNLAASGFASSIIREPLAGQPAVCPVARSAEMFILSPRRAVDALLHAHDLSAARWGANRSLNLPGLTASVGAMVEALGRVAGPGPVARIRWQPDPAVEALVAGWPRALGAARAETLGFAADADIDEIIRFHIEDELGGRWAA